MLPPAEFMDPTGWPVPVAIAAIRRMEAIDVALIEQPVAAGNVGWLVEVRRAVSTPLMADESVFTLADAGALAIAGAVDVLSVYPGKNGGLLRARKIAAVAEACGLAGHVGSNMELGIASAAMAHLAVATPCLDSERFPADIIGPLYHEHDVVTDSGFVRPGRAFAPEGPGLGIELDVAAIQECRLQAD